MLHEVALGFVLLDFFDAVEQVFLGARKLTLGTTAPSTELDLFDHVVDELQVLFVSGDFLFPVFYG